MRRCKRCKDQQRILERNPRYSIELIEDKRLLHAKILEILHGDKDKIDKKESENDSNKQ